MNFATDAVTTIRHIGRQYPRLDVCQERLESFYSPGLSPVEVYVISPEIREDITPKFGPCYQDIEPSVTSIVVQWTESHRNPGGGGI